MKRYILLAAGLLTAAALTACAPPPEDPVAPVSTHIGGSYEIVSVVVPGRGPLTCFIWDGANAGGPSCNWEEFNKVHPTTRAN